jgi:hypothetical protein
MQFVRLTLMFNYFDVRSRLWRSEQGGGGGDGSSTAAVAA